MVGLDLAVEEMVVLAVLAVLVGLDLAVMEEMVVLAVLAVRAVLAGWRKPHQTHRLSMS